MNLNHRTLSRRYQRAGVQAFSLVEVMIAACIMAIVFAALFSGISTTFSLMDVTRENLRATQIMVSRLEGLRLCAWSKNQLFNTNVVPHDFKDSFYPLGLNSTTKNGTIYKGTLTINTNLTLTPSATYANKLASVIISVEWMSNHGSVTNLHQRSMTTYVAQYGMQNYIYAH